MEALYRKYRPSTFADVVGQEHIERTLKNAIEQDKVSHAYLFCGPRGTGKTTTARILAKALMCEKGPTIEPDGTCPECQAIAQGTHPDVYELDAASRTGVENVREEIISRVSYAPTRGAWKVYIIDEVHMLSTAAFNALLKTIEEPPSHVVFILCTTDPQKVPETILSRCQRFDFHRISIESIVARLGAVCVEEGVEFEAEALDLIAHRAEGGMRNALTSLEQLIAYCGGKATLEGAQSLLGSVDNSNLSEIVEAIGLRDAVACFNWVAKYVETGADLAQFVHDLAEHVRTLYLLSMAGLDVELQISESTRTVMIEELKLFGQDRLSRMLILLGDVTKELRISSNPRLSFEIALTRMVRPESDLTLEALAERVEELERRLAGMGSAPVVQAQTPASFEAPVMQPVAPVQPQRASTPAPQRQAAAAAPVSQQAPTQRPAAAQPAEAASRQPNPAVRPQASQQFVPPAQQPSQTAQGSAPAAQAPDVAASTSAQAPQTAGTAAPAQPMPQPASSQPAAQPVPAPQPQQGGMLTAQVDLSNPAAVQRLWHSVTAALRKANPARGVLFMNAKVSAEPNAQGIVVEFSKDSAFAYNAAQKTEVQELLAKTIQTVAGGTVPYRLALAGGASAAPAVSSVSAAPQPASQQAQPANQIKNPYAAKAVAAVRAAQAQAAAQSAAQPAHPSSSARLAVPQIPASFAQQQASNGFAAAPQTQQAQPAWSGQPAASAAQSQQSVPQYQAPATPEPYDDQVPLDVYGASVSAEYDEDPYAQTSYQQSVVQTPASSASFGQPAPGQTPAATSPSAPQPVTPQTAAASNGQSEAEQIKSILTNSFGQGIKFEELPD